MSCLEWDSSTVGLGTRKEVDLRLIEREGDLQTATKYSHVLTEKEGAEHYDKKTETQGELRPS